MLTSGLAPTRLSFHYFRKPSLARVAVFAFDTNGHNKSKDMECQCHRHQIPPFRVV